VHRKGFRGTEAAGRKDKDPYSKWKDEPKDPKQQDRQLEAKINRLEELTADLTANHQAELKQLQDSAESMMHEKQDESQTKLDN
jgi:hypothetical protein